MLNIIQYIYYFVSQKYQKWGEDSISGVYALCFISILQLFNSIALLLIGLILHVINMNEIKSYYAFVLFFIFLALDYKYVYKIVGKQVIFRNFNLESNETTKIKRQALIYTVCTLISFLGLLIYYIRT